MVEVSGAIARNDFRNQSHLVANIFLEGIDVETFNALQLVPSHIEDRSCTQLCGHESLIELEGVIDLVDQFLWDDFTLIILRILSK